MEKKLFTLISVLLLTAFALTACGTPTAAPITAPPATEIPVAVPATEVPAAAPTEAPAAPASGGEVYYLNFKPEVAEIYAKIADEYKQGNRRYAQSSDCCIRDVRANIKVRNCQSRCPCFIPDQWTGRLCMPGKITLRI